MNTGSGLPEQLVAPRVTLRDWQLDDAAMLRSVLAANQAHLIGWIPDAIALVDTVEALTRRIEAFRSDACAGLRERRALIDRHDGTLLGGIDLFGRTATERVPLAVADRLEIGYWIRAESTGRGLVTEAVRALLQQLPAEARWTQAVIRCDVRNLASRRVAERLGFLWSAREAVLHPTDSGVAYDVDTWAHPLPYVSAPPLTPIS